MPMKPKEVCRRLEREGWVFHHQTGSHRHYERDGKKIIVVMHAKDLTPGVERKIKEAAGW